MPAPIDFRQALALFASNQPTKTLAAQKLGISRQDFYRYLDGSASPREARLRQLQERMASEGEQPAIPALPTDFSSLDRKSVTLLRDMMLHLVSLIDLDLSARTDNETGGG